MTKLFFSVFMPNRVRVFSLTTAEFFLFSVSFLLTSSLLFELRLENTPQKTLSRTNTQENQVA